MARFSWPVLGVALILDITAFGLALGAMAKRSKVSLIFLFVHTNVTDRVAALCIDNSSPQVECMCSCLRLNGLDVYNKRKGLSVSSRSKLVKRVSTDSNIRTHTGESDLSSSEIGSL